jgi:hypothetical protein
MSRSYVVVDRAGHEREVADGEVLRDGERLRVSMLAMDGVQRAIHDATRSRSNWDRVPVGVVDTRVVDAREQAYRLRTLDDCNAWRRPEGCYPLSAGEGSVCWRDGRSGHLRAARDGSPWLEFEPDAPAAAPAQRHGDARIASRDAVEAAYEEVRLRDTTAWMRPLSGGISK